MNNTKSLKPYQIRRGKDGVYDKRNRVNNLTGKQWTFSTRSVKTKNYSNRYPPQWGIYQDLLPIDLIKELFLTFTKPSDTIFDPYAITGNSFLAFLELKKRNEYYALNVNDQLVKELLDYNHCLKYDLNQQKPQEVDFIFTQIILLDPNSSDDHNGILYSKKIKSIINKLANHLPVLKDQKYSVVSISPKIFYSLTYKQEIYFEFNRDLISEFRNYNLIPKGEIIWYQNNRSGLNEKRIWVFKKEL